MRSLLLTSALPHPARAGSAQRTQLLYRALAELGSVDVVITNGAPLASLSQQRQEELRSQFGMVDWLNPKTVSEQWPWRVFNALGPSWPSRVAKVARGPSVEYHPQQHIARRVRELIFHNNYDVVVCRYLSPLAMARPDQLLPTLVDVDDLPSEMAAQKLASMETGSLRARYWQRLVNGLRRVETKLVANCHHVWVAKPVDLGLAGDVPSSVLPNIPFPQSLDEHWEPCSWEKDSRCILMVGTMAWQPNEKAVDRFLSESWEEIHRAEPSASFRIVGTGVTPAMRSRWDSYAGVETVGFARDLRVEYQRAAFAICPVWEGGGTNIKVLEALRFGRTVVCTVVGARGYERKLRNEEAILIREDMAQFTDACLRLLRDPKTARRLAEAGCKTVSNDFTYQAFRDSVHAALPPVSDGR